jgi:hypothetical protein
LARPESIALAGYYAAPDWVVAAIAALIRVDRSEAQHYSLLDPCAADGVAIYSLRNLLFEDKATSATVYAVELETKRFAELEKRTTNRHWNQRNSLHGSAFAVEWSMDDDAARSYEKNKNTYTGVNIAYINAPYQNGDLEAKFLERFTPTLMPGGLLVKLLPFYSLHKSATTLACEYTDLRCFRFPDTLFAIYKQCVIFGVRRLTPLLTPDPTLVEQIKKWSCDSDSFPVLPAPGSQRPIYDVRPSRGDTGFSKWRMRPADTDNLMKRFVPWSETDRAGVMHPIAGVTPDLSTSNGGNMMRRVFPVAVKMAKAHTSTAIAAGAMSGRLMEPDDPESGLPKVIIKGTFRRDRCTIETRTNKKGDTVAEVKIERPTLQIVALDIANRKYVHLRNDASESDATSLDQMTVGDVIACYGTDLVRVMRENCPLLYDSDDVSQHWQLPQVGGPGRALYTAQQHAVRGLVALLGGVNATRRQRRGQAAYLLGEVGVGKSFIASAVAKCIGANVVLIMCPPHLGDGWIEQVQLALPGNARAVLLHDLIDVDNLAKEVRKPWAGPGPRPIVFAILTTSTAKLQHVYAGVRSGRCPDCGETTPKFAKAEAEAAAAFNKAGVGDMAELVKDAHANELARTRAHCKVVRRMPNGRISRAANAMAMLMIGVAPYAAEIGQCLSGRFEERAVEVAQRRVGEAGMKGGKVVADQSAWDKIRHNQAMRLAVHAGVRSYLVDVEWDKHAHTRREARRAMIAGLLWSLNDDALTAETAENIYRFASKKENSHEGDQQRAFARILLHLLPVGSAEQNAARETLVSIQVKEKDYAYGGKGMNELWRDWNFQRDIIVETGIPLNETFGGKHRVPTLDAGLEAAGGCVATWNGFTRGSAEAAIATLGIMAKLGSWKDSAPCGCPLFQAIPRPKKVALASYIGKYYAKLFDLFILDEAHEGRGGDAVAQSVAMRRLIRLGIPTICATGSVMGGYAEDLFAMQWAIDPKFRAEFPNGFSSAEHIQGDVIRPRRVSDAPEFGRRYGYLKLLVEAVDARESKKPVGYGRMSDRIDENTRAIGYAPGVLPLFVLRYLLRRAVTIHKADLDKELPACLEIVETVQPNADQVRWYTNLEQELLKSIKEDRKNPSLAGKLMGAMAEIPAYYDLASADVGNVKEGKCRGEYRICYPNNADCGELAGHCIVNAPGLPADLLLPKEEWLIAKCKAELAEGRPCMVFGTHKRLLPRLQRILQEALGEHVALLDADKVDSGERIAWINHNILGKPETVVKRGVETVVPGKTARVLVVNSVAVQTGINNLVHFPTIVWMENPRCMAIAYRQAVGRSHRIGQTKEVRVYFPTYRKTIQEAAHELLMHKVAVSLGTDGLDASSALEAAGVGGGDGVDGFSVAKLLHDLATGERVGITRKKRGPLVTRAAAPKAAQEAPKAEEATFVLTLSDEPAKAPAAPSVAGFTPEAVLAIINELYLVDQRGPKAADVAARLGAKSADIKPANDSLRAMARVTTTGQRAGMRYQPTGT